MPVEIGYTVILALKRMFRLPNESSEPEPRDVYLPRPNVVTCLHHY